MAERRMGIIAFLICICLWLMPCSVQAASTADAKESISTDTPCNLIVTCCYGETAFSDLSVKLYRVADVSADFRYTLTPRFASSEIAINGVTSAAEWNVIRSTLEAYIAAEDMTEDLAAVTDSLGRAWFSSLSPGLYLIVPANGSADEMLCLFDSALISLPGLGTDGLWQYQVTAACKGVFIPQTEADKEISYKVMKLWKGDSNSSGRPQKIEAEIFRNGESYQTVILSEENHWSYSWSVKNDGTKWTVAEKTVPAGYIASMEKRDTTFLLTNTRIPETSPTESQTPSGGQAPKTGDTSNILLYILLLCTSGILLVLLGVFGKNRRV